jgi:hypothetical protein
MNDVTALVAAMAPSDPAQIVAALRRWLYRSMKPRANGTRHLDSCRNARVNASWFECQKECTDAQVSLVWAERFLTAHERPQPEQRSFLEGVAG